MGAALALNSAGGPAAALPAGSGHADDCGTGFTAVGAVRSEELDVVGEMTGRAGDSGVILLDGRRGMSRAPSFTGVPSGLVIDVRSVGRARGGTTAPCCGSAADSPSLAWAGARYGLMAG